MTNYFIAIVGRGVVYGGMASAEQLEELAARCQHSVNCGFEVYIYSLEPSPVGPNSLLPDGVLPLKREFHLFDASEDFQELVDSIIEKLSCHSIAAGRKHLADSLPKLQAELEKLNELAQTAGLHDVEPKEVTTDP